MKQNTTAQRRIRRHGASNHIDETRPSRLTGRDATRKSRVDSTAKPMSQKQQEEPRQHRKNVQTWQGLQRGSQADNGDTIDNNALGQLFKYTGKNDSHFVEWTPQFQSSWEPVLNRKSLRPKRQKTPIVRVVQTFCKRQIHCLHQCQW